MVVVVIIMVEVVVVLVGVVVGNRNQVTFSLPAQSGVTVECIHANTHTAWHNTISCDGKICIRLPFVNLEFVSYYISNECLPIQLRMLNFMLKENSGLKLV